MASFGFKITILGLRFGMRILLIVLSLTILPSNFAISEVIDIDKNSQISKAHSRELHANTGQMYTDRSSYYNNIDYNVDYLTIYYVNHPHDIKKKFKYC